MVSKKKADAAAAPQEEPKEQPKKLVVDGVAESPFKAFPGRVVFPPTLTGAKYRIWCEAVKRQPGDTEGDVFRLVPQWRAVQVLGDIQIKGLPEHFDDIPAAVLNWLASAVDEYVADGMSWR